MAVRIRKDGTIVCAAMHPAQEGDTYLHDGIHYILSAELHALVTGTTHGKDHFQHGLWWWAHEVPDHVEVDKWWERAPA